MKCQKCERTTDLEKCEGCREHICFDHRQYDKESITLCDSCFEDLAAQGPWAAYPVSGPTGQRWAVHLGDEADEAGEVSEPRCENLSYEQACLIQAAPPLLKSLVWAANRLCPDLPTCTVPEHRRMRIAIALANGNLHAGTPSTLGGL